MGCNQASSLSPGRQVVGTRILFVHGIEAIGGAERDLIALLKTLDRRKWEPHVVCPGTGSFQEQLHAIAPNPILEEEIARARERLPAIREALTSDDPDVVLDVWLSLQ